MSETPFGGPFDRRLLIVTGKGGVGKSTVAAALAWRAAAAGQRVLACELDAKGDLAGALLGVGPPHPGSAGTRYEPDELHDRLFAMAMDPEASLKEYLRLHLRIPLVTKLGALSAAFDFLAHAAPGVREIVTIGKVVWEVREQRWDLVVCDATAIGHILGQLRAPQAINELVGVGAIRGQTAWMLEILRNPTTTGLVLVTTAEEMPVAESVELLCQLDANDVAVAAVVVNRLLPRPPVLARPDADDAGPWDGAGGDAALDGVLADVAVLDALGGKAAYAALRDGARLTAALRHLQEEHIARLRAGVAASPTGARAPVLEVPLVFDADPGLPVTRAIAAALDMPAEAPAS